MSTVKEILDEKGCAVWSIHPDASVYEAIELMAEKGVGAVLVTRDQKLEGILSERDYARKVILRARSSKETPVRDIMTPDVITVSPATRVEDAMGVMTERHIRHLPVVEGGAIRGVVSIGDLVKWIIDEQKYVIRQLEGYIAS
ncbi:MAG: CBS domain-containing protein [Thermoanaerobaculia bacterium]